MEQDIPTIKRVQGRLGVKDDGVAGEQTFKALSIAVGIKGGQYTKPDLIAEIQKICGYETTGVPVDDGVFWNAVLNYLDQQALANEKDTGEFFTIEIPKPKATIPDSAPIVALLSKVIGPLLSRFKGGASSRGTFSTGLVTTLGGITLLVQGYTSDDPELATNAILGGVNSLIAGIGLLLARDAKVSDEQAGAKKLNLT